MEDNDVDDIDDDKDEDAAEILEDNDEENGEGNSSLPELSKDREMENEEHSGREEYRLPKERILLAVQRN